MIDRLLNFGKEAELKRLRFKIEKEIFQGICCAGEANFSGNFRDLQRDCSILLGEIEDNKLPAYEEGFFDKYLNFFNLPLIKNLNPHIIRTGIDNDSYPKTAWLNVTFDKSGETPQALSTITYHSETMASGFVLLLSETQFTEAGQIDRYISNCDLPYFKDTRCKKASVNGDRFSVGLGEESYLDMVFMRFGKIAVNGKEMFVYVAPKNKNGSRKSKKEEADVVIPVPADVVFTMIS